MRLCEDEISFSRLSLVDIGRVFWWSGRVFRAILPESTPAIKKLFSSGLIDRLVSEKLLIGSRLTDYVLDGYGLIIEHDVVPVPTYPREWSFGMLKDAGLLVLSLNEIACKFGYQTKDCNGYNVLFHQGRPIYVDLGSFVPVAMGEDVLLPYEEFLRSYTYPLLIWRSAGQYLGNRVAPRAVGTLLTQEAYLRFRWPLLRVFDDVRLRTWWSGMTFLHSLRHQNLTKRQGRIPRLALLLLSFVKKAGWLRGPARICNLRRHLDKLMHKTGSSLWANYHDAFDLNGELRSTARFDAIVSRLTTLGVSSILEIGGNQGVLSRLLARRLPQAKFICTDPDGIAIDKGYRASRQSGETIEWAILNPFASESSPLEVPVKDRLRSDAVVVLALTHHLAISHNFRLDYIFDVIAGFAEQFVLVEFMPLGLHDGTSAPPLPAGYDEAWFSEAFCRRFDQIERVQLEANRILYVGKIRHALPNGHATNEPPI